MMILYLTMICTCTPKKNQMYALKMYLETTIFIYKLTRNFTGNLYLSCADLYYL